MVYPLDKRGTLRARAFQRLTASRLRLAREVAFVIGGALCLVATLTVQAQQMPIQKTDSPISLDSYAQLLLTQKTYKCFRTLAFRESSWDGTDNSPSFKARNGSHYGFMQGKSKWLKGATADEQFWWSFKYVAIGMALHAMMSLTIVVH